MFMELNSVQPASNFTVKEKQYTEIQGTFPKLCFWSVENTK